MTRIIEQPISEVTLRKYEKISPDTDRREVYRKLCMSLGILNAGESRDIMIDLFQAIADSRKALATKDIMNKVISQRKKYNLPMLGLTYPNVCRQLRRLKQLMLIESRADKYRLNQGDSLKKIFNDRIIKYSIPSIQERINEYIDILR